MKWNDYDDDSKMALILALQEQRAKLVSNASKKTATKSSVKKKAHKIKFKSDELEKLFYSLPEDVKKFITGG
jgi:hypothetical protein